MNANNDPQDLWKRSETTLPEPLAAEICALARRRERESVWGRRISLFALAGLAIAFAHNTWEVDQPWVRLGQGWMLLVMTVCLWSLIRNRTHLRASNDSCGSFLLRSLKMKRDGYLAVRRIVLLIIPASFGELVGWRRRTEGACHGSRSGFSLLSVFDERLADDRHLCLAASCLVSFPQRGEKGLR